MKIILLAIYDVYSFGIRGLHSILKSKGYDVTSVFFKNSTYDDSYWHQYEFERLIATIKKLKPDLLCVGVRSPLFPLFKEISNRLRPDISILVGGFHPTADPESCVPYADYVCMGEGEEIITRVVNGVSGNSSLKRLRGLYPNGPGDSILFDHYGNSDIYLFANPRFDTQTELVVWTTRDCFFNCAYCAGSVTKRFYGKQITRRRSVSNIIKCAQNLQRKFTNLKELIITDPVFTYDMDWLRKFCNRFHAETGLTFRCFGHPLMTTYDMLATLKDSGMSEISFGIESGSPKIMKLFNRHVSNERVIELSRSLSSLGMKGRFDIIVNNPFDTLETLRETRELIKRLYPPFTIRNFELRFFPGTAMTNTALETGAIKEDDVEGSRWCKFGNWHFNYECK